MKPAAVPAYPLFADGSAAAFSGCPSYKAQLSHGIDTWRATLDGSCGIDIYGHNGLSCGDIDGAGRDSIYICQPAGLPNRLYRNRGNGTFEDITDFSGVGLLENTACALFADFSNRGRQDLVVVRATGPLLFLNEGGGKFRLQENSFRFATAPQGTFTGAAAADYNRDGLLDIYFCLYTFYQGTGQYKYPSPYFAAENGPSNFLMHNNGDGTFRDVTAETGLNQNNTRFSFCCAWSDMNGDGWPDLYVSNDFGRKNLYRNNGDGTFRDDAAESGADDVGAGMSVAWLDYDNDDRTDLYVANMWTAAGERISADSAFQVNAPPQAIAMYRKHAMGNSLLHNQGHGRFSDATAQSDTGMGRWSWSSDAWDFDHDGFQDLYITNGMISGQNDADLNSFFWRQVVAKSPNTAANSVLYEQGWNTINDLIRSGGTWSGFERNVLYANNRDGTFTDLSGTLGLDFLQDSRSFVLADFDGDGRQEMLLKNRNAPQLRLTRSIAPDLPPSISFRLSGTQSNRDAIGAAITIETSAGRQTNTLAAGSGFLAQHSKELFFGLGESTGGITATVRWPSGLIQTLHQLPPNHRITVREGHSSPKVEAFNPASSHTHSENRFVPEQAPQTAETWLLVPVTAPAFPELSSFQGQPTLLTFTDDASITLQALLSNHAPVSARASDDLTAIYNLLFRYLFDLHRDLPLPSSFLLDGNAQVVKVYQGGVDPLRAASDARFIPKTDRERLSKALPFPGVAANYEFGRNYLSLGSIFFQRGYTSAAGDFFRAALKDDPSSAEACYGIGSVYLDQGNNQQAREAFERAVKLKPAYPETGPDAWNNLGLLSARDGDTMKAVTYFEQALRLDPNHFVTLENLGSAYREQQRWEEARAALERALAIEPADAQANYNLAMVFAETDDTSRAYDYLQKALQAKPGYPEALNNLGILYLRIRRRDQAVATFEACIHAAPDFDQSYLNLARVYAIEGAGDKARSVLNALLAKHPDNGLARQALAKLQ